MTIGSQSPPALYYPGHNNSPIGEDTMTILQRSVSVWQRWALYRKRYRQRQEMMRLSDHMLKDIGVSRYDIMREAEKPFWRE